MSTLVKNVAKDLTAPTTRIADKVAFLNVTIKEEKKATKKTALNIFRTTNKDRALTLSNFVNKELSDIETSYIDYLKDRHENGKHINKKVFDYLFGTESKKAYAFLRHVLYNTNQHSLRAMCVRMESGKGFTYNAGLQLITTLTHMPVDAYEAKESIDKVSIAYTCTGFQYLVDSFNQSK